MTTQAFTSAELVRCHREVQPIALRILLGAVVSTPLNDPWVGIIGVKAQRPAVGRHTTGQTPSAP